MERSHKLLIADLMVLTAAMQDVYCLTLRGSVHTEHCPLQLCSIQPVHFSQLCSLQPVPPYVTILLWDDIRKLGNDGQLIPHPLGSQTTITFWQSWLWPYLLAFCGPCCLCCYLTANHLQGSLVSSLFWLNSAFFQGNLIYFLIFMATNMLTLCPIP